MNWNNIILEGFCVRKTCLRRGKYLYKIISLNPLKTEKIPNKDYDPHYRTPRKPKFCENSICFTCLGKNCKFLAFCDAEKEAYRHMDKFYVKGRTYRARKV